MRTGFKCYMTLFIPFLPKIINIFFRCIGKPNKCISLWTHFVPFALFISFSNIWHEAYSYWIYICSLHFLRSYQAQWSSRQYGLKQKMQDLERDGSCRLPYNQQSSNRWAIFYGSKAFAALTNSLFQGLSFHYQPVNRCDSITYAYLGTRRNLAVSSFSSRRWLDERLFVPNRNG